MKYISTPRIIKSTATSLILAISAFVIASFAQTDVDTSFSAVPSKAFPNGTSINQIVQPDGKVVVYGPRMVAGGVARGDIIRLNVDGSVDSTFNYCGCGIASISNVMLATDGKLLVGGADVGYSRIIRLNVNGSVDPTFSVSKTAPSQFVGGAIFTVDAIQPDGKVLATNRSSQQGFVAYWLYRFNGDGTDDTGFTPIAIASGSPINATVRVRLLSDGRFYLASTASNFGSSAVLNRKLSNGQPDTTWETPSFSTAGFPAQTSISDLEVAADGSIFVAGAWSAVNGLDRKYLVKLMPAGNVDMSFNGPAVLSGTGVEILPDGKILFSGNTDVANVYKLFRLNADGSLDGTYVQDPAVLNIRNSWGIDSLQRTVFYASTTTGERFVRLNSNGSLDGAYSPSVELYGTVNALARQMDGKVIVAGVFTQMNGVARSNFARVNADGSLDLSFDAGTGFSAPPSQLLMQNDGKIIAVGDFASYNGTTVTGIVRINSNGSIDNTFNVTTNQRPRVITRQVDDKLIIGGSFNTVNGSTRTGVARLNTDGTLDPTFNPTIGGSAGVYTIAVLADSKVMVGGSFSGVNGFNRNNLVRLNSDGSLDQTFTATGVGSVTKLILHLGDKFLIGTGLPTTAISRRNFDGSADSTFVAPSLSASSSSDTEIDSIFVLSDSSILVGGVFNTVAGISRSYLTRLASNGGFDRLFPSPSANARVRTMERGPVGKVIAGGDLNTIFGSTRSGISQLNVAPFRIATPYDFDGDGRADFTVFRPSTNQWYELLGGGTNYEAPVFGLAGDIPVPADFDGDGKTDEAIYRPSTGTWWYQSSVNGAQLARQYGVGTDLPRPGDFDGDGKADFIVFRPSTNQWYRSGSGVGEVAAYSFGLAGDQPVIGDFDGDGKVDPAIFRPSTGDWWYAASSAGNQHRAAHWGATGDIPTPADFDGDKKTDIAVYRPSTGVWYIYNSSNLSFTILPFGISEDRPVVADYDGDGKADIALFRPSTGIWYLLRSTAGFTGLQWGVSSDVAAPAAFNP